MDRSSNVSIGSLPAGADDRLSRRRFLQGLAGLSLGTTGLGVLTACRGRAAGPAPKRLPLIGNFSVNTAEGSRATLAALREGLEASGYREGQTIQIESRYADGDPNRWPDIAGELVGLHPDVIVMSARPLPNVLSYTRTIPIVMVSPLTLGVDDLIGLGIIKSQAHPGGNVTGLVSTTPTLWGKRLDLLRETVPGATRVGALRDPQALNPLAPPPAWVSKVVPMLVSQPADLEAAFAAAEQNQVEALAVSAGGGRVVTYLDKVAEQARRHRLPAICDFDTFAPSGGLMSYTADLAALYRGAGGFVGRILKGASPADLPVELPTAFKLVINKATAAALGLAIPPAVLAQATEVLE